MDLEWTRIPPEAWNELARDPPNLGFEPQTSANYAIGATTVSARVFPGHVGGRVYWYPVSIAAWEAVSVGTCWCIGRYIHWSFTHVLTDPLVCLFVHVCLPSFINSFINLFVHSLIYELVCWFPHSRLRSCARRVCDRIIMQRLTG